MTLGKNTQCHYAECHHAEYHCAECHYAECHYAQCHYAVCHFTECRGTWQGIIIIKIVMLRVESFLLKLLLFIVLSHQVMVASDKELINTFLPGSEK